MKKKKIALLITFAFILLIILFLFCTQKGHELRRFAAETILSSQHQYLVVLTFLPQSEIDGILNNINNPKYINTIIAPTIQGDNVSSPNIDKGELTIPSKDDPLIVNVETISNKDSTTSYYEGKIMTISNPHNVKLVTASTKDMGQQIFVIAKNAGAIAATNASGFDDPNGVGNGGKALGIIIADGKNENTTQSDFVAALRSDGQLITGFYSPQELLNLDVESAAGFKPQLISNGKKMITSGDGGWGVGPRTAIGQTKDGKIILIVIDGRQPHSIGATMKQVQDLLYDRGVINAIAMDGGSSASMYLNGDNITTPSSVGHVPRYLPDIWAVIPNEGQQVKVTYDDNVIMDEDSYKK